MSKLNAIYNLSSRVFFYFIFQFLNQFSMCRLTERCKILQYKTLDHSRVSSWHSMNIKRVKFQPCLQGEHYFILKQRFFIFFFFQLNKNSVIEVRFMSSSFSSMQTQLKNNQERFFQKSLNFSNQTSQFLKFILFFLYFSLSPLPLLFLSFLSL